MVAGSKNAGNSPEVGLTDPAAIFADGNRVDAAICDSIKQVRILHKRMGVPLVGSIDGKLVEIPPEEIETGAETKEGD